MPSINLMVDGQVTQLAEIAELDNLMLDDVQENYGGDIMPAGIYQLAVRKAERTAGERTLDGTKRTVAIIKFEFEATNVLSLTDANLQTDDFIGRKHFESIAITDLKRDLGRIKALMTASGYSANGVALHDLLLGFVGHEFIAVIANRPDKNDKDIVYANINLKKVKPVAV